MTVSMVSAGTAFDAVAARYDELWSRTAVGMSQRRAVWSHIDPLFQPGHSILDLGCGTGEDALHFESRGVRVYAIDASAGMVGIARQRGVDAHHSTVEALGNLGREFDGAISNFGVLNCVDDLRRVASHLSRLVRPGGFAGLCVMGPFCLWETLHFLLRGKLRQAFRRLRRGKVPSSLGIDIHYPAVAPLTSAFSRAFKLVGWYGIGVCVPPSYIQEIGDATVERLSRFDGRLAHLPVVRAIGDHRLFVLRRL